MTTSTSTPHPLRALDPAGPTWRESIGPGTGASLVPRDPSPDVDEQLAADLLDAARQAAARIGTRGIGTTERLARGGAAADAARDLRDVVALLNPYADARHSRTVDLATIGDQRARPAEQRAASERLDLADQHQQLTRAFADLTGAGWHLVDETTTTPTPDTSEAVWLNSPYVTPAVGDLGRGRLVSDAWASPPAAFLDPAAGDDVSVSEQAILEGTPVPWHVAALALNASRQRLEWAADEGTDTDTLLTRAVDLRLETALIADLTTGAPTAPSYAAAESAAAGATSAAADLVLVTPADRPNVIRQYATQLADPADRPVILGTAGALPGVAAVISTRGITAEAAATQWLLADEPRVIGKAVAALRYGLAAVRVPGAVQLVRIGG